MALQVLYSSPLTGIHQNAEHDIESIFYVLLYVCLKLNGPDSWHHKSCRIDKWFDPCQSFQDLAEMKAGYLQYFSANLTAELPEYFTQFNNLLTELHLAMFPDDHRGGRDRTRLPGNVASHQPILTILKKAYDDLSDSDPSSTSTSTAVKRKSDATLSLSNSKRNMASWQGPISPSAKTPNMPMSNMEMTSSPERSRSRTKKGKRKTPVVISDRQLRGRKL
jgi:hypothetical protein